MATPPRSLALLKQKTGFPENRLKSGFSKSTDAQVSLDLVQIIIANRQDTYFSNHPIFPTPLVRIPLAETRPKTPSELYGG